MKFKVFQCNFIARWMRQVIWLMLALTVTLSNAFAQNANSNSLWPTAPSSWYGYYASWDNICGGGDEYTLKAFPSLAALANAIVSRSNMYYQACPGDYSWTNSTSIFELQEGNYFSLISTCHSALSECPFSGPSNPQPYVAGSVLVPLVNPDLNYQAPTCASGPQSVPCQNMDQACPPGFAAIGCTRPIDPKNLGPTNSCSARPSAGNPIDIATGNKYQVERDYLAAGASPLAFQRTYNGTTVIQTGTSGANWRGTYERSITLYEMANQTTAALFRPDGKILYFSYVGGAFVSSGDINDRLDLVVDNNGNTAGFSYISASNDETESYDLTGRLIAITSRTNVKQTLSYNEMGNLSKVTDSFGRQIQFGGITNKIYNMTDPAGGVYSYEYGYNNNLVSVTYPDAKVRHYLYENTSFPNALTGIVDENGQRFATWSYDAQGRATSSEHAGGANKVTLSYGTDNTAVTDALGTLRSYSFLNILDSKKSASTSQPGGAGCGAASSSISYDANGNMASRTDFNGNVTTYTYDLSRNLETSRVEGAGTAMARTISTEWHPTYHLPLRIAEPKKLTINSYDAHGNLLSKSEQATADVNGSQGFDATTVGFTRIWHYTYNDFGQVLSATDPRGHVTAYTYDGQGNVVSITNAVNQVTTLSNYDANGRVGRITDPNGLVTDLTYSPRGWLTSRKAGDELTQYDYDGVGQLTKVTQPDGSTITYTYDDAHRLTDIADALGNHIHYTLDAMDNRISEQATDPNGTLARQTSRVYDALNRLQQITGAQQ